MPRKLLIYKALKLIVADRTGLEPATSAVTGQHSNQLNYRSLHIDRLKTGNTQILNLEGKDNDFYLCKTKVL